MTPTCTRTCSTCHEKFQAPMRRGKRGFLWSCARQCPECSREAQVQRDRRRRPKLERRATQPAKPVRGAHISSEITPAEERQLKRLDPLVASPLAGLQVIDYWLKFA